MVDSNNPCDELFRHAGFVKHLARDLRSDPNSSDDLVQDTWVVALQSPPSSTTGVKGWLKQVCRRLAIREGRTQERRLRREQATASHELSRTTVEECAWRETLRQVTDCVLALSEPNRQVILLHYYEGLSPEAIANRLEVSRATIYSRLSRGLEQLRHALDQKNRGNRSAWVQALAPLTLDLPTRRRSTDSDSTTLSIGRVWVGVALSGLLVATGVWWWRDGKLGDTGDGPPSPSSFISETRTNTQSVEKSDQRLEAPVRELASSKAATGDSRQVESPPVPREDEASARTVVRMVWQDDGTPLGDRWVQIVPRKPSAAEFPALKTDDQGELPLPDGGADILALVDPVAHQTLKLPEHPAAFDTIRWEIPAGLDVSGTVADIRGHPVGKASIWIGHPERTLPPVLVDVSHAQGEFHLRGVAPESRLCAMASGYQASRFQSVEGIPGSSVRATVILAPGCGVLTGQVLDESGRPVPGARIRMKGRHEADLYRFDGVALHDLPPWETRADSKGRYRFDSLVPGPVQLVVTAPGYAPTAMQRQLPRQQSEQDLVLTKGVCISGQVQDLSGAPVADAVIEMRDTKSPWQQMVRVDAAGTYELLHLPNSAQLVVRSPSAGVARRLIAEGSGRDRTWNPVLHPGRTVHGRLQDSSGQPLGGRTIHAVGNVPRGDQRSLWSSQARTDATGEFRLLGCPDEPLQLEILRHVQIGDIELAVRIEPNDPMPLTLVLEPTQTPSAWIRGFLVDPAGQPIVGRVEGFSHGLTAGSTLFQEATTDSRGHFLLGPLAPGLWQLRARRHHGPLVSLSRINVGSGETVDLGKSLVEFSGWLEIRTERPREPVFERFQVIGNGNLQNHAISQDRIALSPGEYTVTLWGRNTALVTHEVTIAPQQLTTLDVRGTAGTLCRFRFQIAEGRISHTIGFSLFSGDRLLGHWWHSVQESKTREQRLSPGSYDLEIHGTGRPTFRRRVEVRPGQPELTEQLVIE